MKKISPWVWLVGVTGVVNVILAVVMDSHYASWWHAAFGAQAVMTAITMYTADEIMAQHFSDEE